MYRSNWLLIAALVGTSVAVVQPAVVALSATEVKSIAQAVTVEIQLSKDESVGSGVIIAHQGDLYTIATNQHVVCGGKSPNKLPVGESYDLRLADEQHYRVSASSIKLLGTDLDLAIIQFRSQRNYAVAKVAPNDSLKAADKVYTAGFPPEQSGFNFNEGKAIAVVNKRLAGDRGGYTIIYDAATLPGMSGGGVFNSDGLLVAIHGQGERYRKNTLTADSFQVDTKIGMNRGIPVRWVVQSLEKLSINLAISPNQNIRPDRQVISTPADEHFIAGFNKLVDPGEDILAGKRQAIEEFSLAIKLNPKYVFAYKGRALIYSQLYEVQKALADYNQAIALDPRNSGAYNNRGGVKYESSDLQGALADFNQAISINPKDGGPYYNRALLKEKLNDVLGALADFNQAISIDPKSGRAYNNRGILKKKLNDFQGAMADYNQAIALSPKSSIPYDNRGLLKKQLNDVSGALADYNQAIALNPKYSSAYGNRGVLKQDKLNDTQGALADFNQAISINPKDAYAYNKRGVLRIEKLNDMKGALGDFNQAISIDPKSGQAYFNRALLKEDKFNDVHGALADYNQAIFIDPKNADTYTNRGVLKRKLNDVQGALADYNQAISINPQLAEAYINRAVLKSNNLEDRSGAIQDCRQAAQIFRSQGQTQNLQKAIKALRQLGATE